MKNILDRLSILLKERKNADPSSSYVASLYAKGNKKIIEKIAEETDELIAEINENLEKDKVVHEAADLWFHVMVLLTNNGIDPGEVLIELENREGLSGIEEKKGRKE
jgi:phosphoribosyl-ATP pyrophosphohydrolase